MLDAGYPGALNVTISQFTYFLSIISASWFLFLSGGRWLGYRLDFLVSLFSLVIGVTSVLLVNFIPTQPGFIGLSLVYATSMLGLVQWGVRQSAEVENHVKL